MAILPRTRFSQVVKFLVLYAVLKGRYRFFKLTRTHL
jgi:hypothetical protein